MTLTDLCDASRVPLPLAANGTCRDRDSLDQGDGDDRHVSRRGMGYLLDAVRRTRQAMQMEKSIRRNMTIESRLKYLFFESSRRDAARQ